MKKYTENVQVKFSKEEKEYLEKVSNIYGYKRCNFIRDAVIEKMQRDVPKLRKKLKNSLTPF